MRLNALALSPAPYLPPLEIFNWWDKAQHAWVEAMREQPALQETLHKPGDKVLLADGMLKGLEAVYMHTDGEMRAMVLIDLLSKPHLISYEAAHLLPNH